MAELELHLTGAKTGELEKRMSTLIANGKPECPLQEVQFLMKLESQLQTDSETDNQRIIKCFPVSPIQPTPEVLEWAPAKF